MIKRLRNYLKYDFNPNPKALAFLKYIGPGLLVTVGFIDPGNWAANVAAGSQYGYSLLWMVTLSTVMLIFLQHNVAHLGIATGLCLSEAASKYLPRPVSSIALGSAVLASVSTALAEILGAAIGLNMLFNIPLKVGAVMTTVLVSFLLLTNSYTRLEKFIIGFVSLIGLSFIYEILQVNVEWMQAGKAMMTPVIPLGAMPIVMSVLGAVVMPHNLFLHSEVIQSRQWNLEGEDKINKRLKYEFADTIFSMLVGWAINSAIIILAATAFYKSGLNVTELSQAKEMLTPVAGHMAGVVFAMALLFAGLASSVTAGMAGGSIFAGIFGEPYQISDKHSKIGVIITYAGALTVIFFITDPFRGLIISQMLLSVQLPVTIALQIYLTSSRRVMGKHANSRLFLCTLCVIGAVVTALNVMLLLQM